MLVFTQGGRRSTWRASMPAVASARAARASRVFSACSTAARSQLRRLRLSLSSRRAARAALSSNRSALAQGAGPGCNRPGKPGREVGDREGQLLPEAGEETVECPLRRGLDTARGHHHLTGLRVGNHLPHIGALRGGGLRVHRLLSLSRRAGGGQRSRLGGRRSGFEDRVTGGAQPARAGDVHRLVHPRGHRVQVIGMGVERPGGGAEVDRQPVDGSRRTPHGVAKPAARITALQPHSESARAPWMSVPTSWTDCCIVRSQ